MGSKKKDKNSKRKEASVIMKPDSNPSLNYQPDASSLLLTEEQLNEKAIRKEKKRKQTEDAAKGTLDTSLNINVETPEEKAIRKELKRKRKSEKRKRKALNANLTAHTEHMESDSNANNSPVRTDSQQIVSARVEHPQESPTATSNTTAMANGLINSTSRYQNRDTRVEIKELENVVNKVRVTNVDLTLDNRLLSKKMRPSKQDDVQGLQKTYNIGAFSNQEKEQVDNAFRQILQELQVPITDAVILITPKSSRLTREQKNQYKAKEYRGVMNAVAERAGINRTISQIYYYLRHKYDDLKQGAPQRNKWTAEDDTKLKSLIERLGEGHWTEIELALGRKGAKVLFFKRIDMIV